MTKEEILFPLHQHCPEEIDQVYSHENALQAMDAYARQEAIEFAAFCLSYTSIQSGEWYLKTDGTKPLSDVKFYTTAELYDLYLTHKNKSDVKS